MAVAETPGTISHWNPRRIWTQLRKPVFVPAVLLIAGLVAFAVVYSSTGGDAFEQLNAAITQGVGWWYVLAATGFVIFALYCGLSRIGRIRLGRDDEEPEFSTLSWFTMLFSAGMGIGLVFYGVAEPLSHMTTPPNGREVESGTGAAGRLAMDLTLYHWGLHAWAIYVVVGLGLAYMTFRRGRPLSIRWLLEPMIGRQRTEGWIGHAVDVVAIVGTLFGVATSLGFGVQQITAGLEYLGWVEGSPTFTVVLIAVVTGLATLSVVSGLDRGLKWLSNINMSLAALLALFVLAVGPTLVLIQAMVANTGSYVASLPSIALETWPLATDSWGGDWTIFYWGWWMSWAPFVGMFIARISRGRTIREFVLGVLLTPTLIGVAWFTIFGDSAIIRQLTEGDLLVDGAVNTDTSLFQLLETLPLAAVTSVLAILVIVFFFVTSADSGSLVMDILATGGATETPRLTRLLWTVLEGVAAAVLLLVGGSASLTALQTASIATAVPFSIIMALACISLLRAFHYEVASTPQYMRARIASGGERAEPVAPEPVPRRRIGRRREISSTFAGLPVSGPAAPPADGGQFLIALHSVPPGAVDVDAHGVATVDEDRVVQDPIAGEVFDTPEFAASQAAVDLEQAGDGSGAGAGATADPALPGDRQAPSGG